MHEALRLIGMGILYLSTIILGFVLKNQKRPYVFCTLTLHKLASLSYAVLFIIYICTNIYDNPAFLPNFAFLLTLLSLISLNTTGVILSSKKQFSKIVIPLHIASTIAVPILSALSFMLVL